jgi:hypothetical protein
MAISIILTSTLIYLNYHSNGRDSVAENRSPEPNGNIIDDQLATDNKQHLQSRHFSDNKETLPANLSSNPAAEIRPRRTPVRAVPSGHEELPVERTFLRDGQMYVDTVAATMKSDRFDEVLDQFEQQIQTDVLAMEMTSLYRGALQQHAAGFDLDPGRVACGIRFCTGAMMSSDPAIWEQLSATLRRSEEFPMYLFVSYDHPLDSGLTEHRFMFSVDPETRAATGNNP